MTCPDHADRDPGCARCWLATPPAKRGPRPASVVPSARSGQPAPKPLPCVHVGDRLTVAEIRAAGINPRLSWHRCELGLKKGEAPAGIVCSCRGCGPSCDKYEPDAQSAPP